MNETETPQVNKKPKVSNNRPLTRKEAEFVKQLVDNPKITKQEAYKRAYNTKTTNKATIATEANRTLNKPQVISELSKYNNLVENTIINTINDWGNSGNTRQREIAVDASKWVHDKVHGKAKQSLDVKTTKVSINIDLSGETDAS